MVRKFFIFRKIENFAEIFFQILEKYFFEKIFFDDFFFIFEIFWFVIKILHESPNARVFRLLTLPGEKILRFFGRGQKKTPIMLHSVTLKKNVAI